MARQMSRRAIALISCPPPVAVADLVSMMTFSALPPVLADALAERGFAAPTAVQAAVLSPDAEGRDLIVSAQTGSGKTVAFGLAIANDLLGAVVVMPRGL
jgi:ATP-dependent RNA helicase DeaD